MEELAFAAIQAASDGEQAYCKFLSANDTKLTKAHQSGYLIGINSWELLFPNLPKRDPNAERTVRISWNNGAVITDSRFKFYTSKGELRITRFGKGFPFLENEYCGALFILVRRETDNYDAFVLNTDEDIENFLDALGIGPTGVNRIIHLDSSAKVMTLDSPRSGGNLSTSNTSLVQNDSLDLLKKKLMQEFIATLTTQFPDSKAMSLAAREIDHKLAQSQKTGFRDPDQKIISFAAIEYELFQELERVRYQDIVNIGFKSLDAFIKTANEVLNRRKSRAGKGIEHHLEALFDSYNVSYTAQGITEGNKKPDFIFPSITAYHDASFPTEALTSLAAKRTCKDRWRQIITEADRLKESPKYLFTLQEGNSPAQLEEMHEAGVILVVPKSLISTYPAEYRERIYPLARFIALVKDHEKKG